MSTIFVERSAGGVGGLLDISDRLVLTNNARIGIDLLVNQISNRHGYEDVVEDSLHETGIGQYRERIYY